MAKGLSQSDAGNYFQNTITIDATPPPPVPGDGVPDPFGWPAQTGWNKEATTTSDEIILTGITIPATLTIDFGLVSVAFQNFGPGPFTYNPGDVITMRHTSSDQDETEVIQTCTVGGVEGIFSTTTAPAVPPPVLGDIYSTDFEGVSDVDQLNRDGFSWSYNVRMGRGVSTDQAVSPVQSLKFPYLTRGPDSGSNLVEQRYEWQGEAAPSPDLWVRYMQYIPANFEHRQRSGASSNFKFFSIWGGNHAAYTDGNQRNGPTFLPQLWPIDGTNNPAAGSKIILYSSGKLWTGVNPDEWISNGNTHWWNQEGNPTRSSVGQYGAMIVPSDYGEWMELTWHMKLCTDRNDNTSGYLTGDNPSKGNGGVFELWKDTRNHGGSLVKCIDVQNGDWWTDAIQQPGVQCPGWNVGYLWGSAENSGYSEDTDFYIDDILFTNNDITPT